MSTTEPEPAPESTDDYLDRLVADAPPFTDECAITLKTLLGPPIAELITQRATRKSA